MACDSDSVINWAYTFYFVIGDFNISQTPVICRYLGKKYGMWPSTDEDEWHAEQVNTTIHDFVAEGTYIYENGK